MPVRINKTKKYPVCYVLDMEALRHLEKIITAEGFAVRWTIFLSDSSTLNCPNLDDVLSIPNTKEHHITYIICRGTHTNRYDEVNITFSNPGVLVSSIVYDVSGDVKDVTYIGEKLQEFVLGQRQWYTVLRTAFPGALFMSAFNAAVAVFLLWKHWFLLDKIHPAYLSIVAIMAFSSGLYYLDSKIITWLFPIAVFALGKGKERHDTLQKMRERFFMGFLVAIMAAVIGGLLIS